MSSPVMLDMNTLRQALEQRDLNLLVSLYADDAQMQVIDQNHRPSTPLELRDKRAIADFLTDIYQRDMTHRVIDEVVGGDRIAYNQSCQYPNGQRVFASSTLDLRNGKIVRQVTVLAWDE